MVRPGFEWFVAWRYLRERGRRSGLVTIAVGVVLLTAAAIVFYVAVKRHPPRAAEILAGARDWKRILKAVGVVSLALGVLVTVFGYLHSLQSIFTTISTYGVFLGTAALVIVLSVMNGFEVDLRQKILGSNAHVQITKEDGAFTEWRAAEGKLDAIPGIIGHSAYVSSEVVVSANSNYAGVVIKGIVPETAGRVTDIEKNLDKDTKMRGLWPILPDGGPDRGPAKDLPDAAPAPDANDDEAPPTFTGPDAGTALGSPTDAGTTGATSRPTAGSDHPLPPTPGGILPPPGGPTGPSGLLRRIDRFRDDNDLEPPTIFDGPDGPGGGARGLHLPPDIPVPDALKERKVIGVHGHSPLDDDFVGMRGSLANGDPRVRALDGILVGRELYKNLHLYQGEEVEVVSPLGQDTPMGQVPRTRSFRVAGTFYSGMYEYDTKSVYVTLPALQKFLSMGDEVTGIEVKVENLDDTGPIVAKIQEALGPGYHVQDWKELNRNLFSALKLEKIAMFLVLTIIILVASFSIISNLIMVVVEKGREIAILKSMGASDRGVMRIFMIEGLYIGALGTVFGLVVGMATCWALGRFGLPLDPEVYYIDKLPVAMDPLAVAAVALAGVLISFIATIYPSFVAARLRPVDALRNE